MTKVLHQRDSLARLNRVSDRARQRILELEARDAAWTAEAGLLKKRIAELEAAVDGLTERLVRKDLPGAFTVAFGKQKAMAAILDSLPHICGNGPANPDCPACAWAKLKEATNG